MSALPVLAAVAERNADWRNSIVVPRGPPALLDEIDPATVRASLLADDKGVFGVGLTVGDAVVGRGGRRKDEPHVYAIFLRHLETPLHQLTRPVLQAIPRGRRWRTTAEYELADVLLTCMLARAGC